MTENLQATRDGFGQGLLQAAEADERIVVLSADLDESLRLEAFKKQFPERFIQCGVAEQNMMGIAAGMALQGKIPFVCSFAAFNPGRNLDQLRVALYSQLPIKIIGGHAGITTGEDGATHQALEDLAITSSLPHLGVSLAADAAQAAQLTQLIAQTSQAHYLRLGRSKVASIQELLKQLPNRIPDAALPCSLATAQQLTRGSDVTLIASGILVQTALTVAAALQKIHLSAEVINLHTLKPLDRATLIRSVEKTQAVVIAAEHQINSGPTAIVSQFFAQEVGQTLPKAIALECIGIENQFGESGTDVELLQKYHLDTAGFLQKIHKVLEKKKNLLTHSARN